MVRHKKTSKFLTILTIILLFMCCSPLCHATTEASQSLNSSFHDTYTNDVLLAVNDSSVGEYNYLEGMYVSDNGSFLVVLSRATTHYVDVYNSNLEFQNQIVLYSAGSVYAAFDESDGNVLLYFPKENMKIKVKTDGQFISAAEIQGIPEYIREMYDQQDYEKVVHATRYALYTNRNIRSVVVQSKSGDIRYNVRSYDPAPYIIIIVGVVAVFFVFISKRKTGNTGGGSVC